MKNFKKEHDELENSVMNQLRQFVESSHRSSKHVSEKVIQVNVYDYVELTILHDRLTFIDSGGMQFSVYDECSLEDLIDIINKRIEEMYLDWVNNFLTVPVYAEYYNISEDEANDIIEIGRQLNQYGTQL